MNIPFPKMLSLEEIALSFLLCATLRETQSVEAFEEFLNGDTFNVAQKETLQRFLTGQAPTIIHPIATVYDNPHHDLIVPLINRLLREPSKNIQPENKNFFDIFLSPSFFQLLNEQDIRTLHFPQGYYYGSSKSKITGLGHLLKENLSTLPLLFKNKSIIAQLIYSKEGKIEGNFFRLILESTLTQETKEAIFDDIHQDHPTVMEDLKNATITVGIFDYPFRDYYFLKNKTALLFFKKINFFSHCEKIALTRIDIENKAQVNIALLPYIEMYLQSPSLSCFDIIQRHAISSTIATTFIDNLVLLSDELHKDRLAQEKETLVKKNKATPLSALEYYFVVDVFSSQNTSVTANAIAGIKALSYWGNTLLKKYEASAEDINCITLALTELTSISDRESLNLNSFLQVFTDANDLARGSLVQLSNELTMTYILNSNTKLRFTEGSYAWNKRASNFEKKLRKMIENDTDDFTLYSIYDSLAYFKFYTAQSSLIALLSYDEQSTSFQLSFQLKPENPLKETISALTEAIALYEKTASFFELSAASLYNYWQAQYELAALQGKAALVDFFHRFKNDFEKEQKVLTPVFSHSHLFEKFQRFQDSADLEIHPIYQVVEKPSFSKTIPFEFPHFKRWRHELLLKFLPIHGAFFVSSEPDFKRLMHAFQPENPEAMLWLKSSATFFHDSAFFSFFLSDRIHKDVKRLNRLMQYLHSPVHLSLYKALFLKAHFDKVFTKKELLNFIQGLVIPSDFMWGTDQEKNAEFSHMIYHPYFEEIVLTSLQNTTFCDHLLFLNTQDNRSKSQNIDEKFLKTILSANLSIETRAKIVKIFSAKDNPIRGQLNTAWSRLSAKYPYHSKFSKPASTQAAAIHTYEYVLSTCLASDLDARGLILYAPYQSIYQNNMQKEDDKEPLKLWQCHFSKIVKSLMCIVGDQFPLTPILASAHHFLSELHWLQAGIEGLKKNHSEEDHAEYLRSLSLSIYHLSKALSFYVSQNQFPETLIFNYWFSRKLFLENIRYPEMASGYEFILKKDFLNACLKYDKRFINLFSDSPLSPYVNQFKQEKAELKRLALAEKKLQEASKKISPPSLLIKQPLLRQYAPAPSRALSFKHEEKPVITMISDKTRAMLMNALPFREDNIILPPPLLTEEEEILARREADLKKFKSILHTLPFENGLLPKKIMKHTLQLSVGSCYIATLPKEQATATPYYFCWISEDEDELAPFSANHAIGIESSAKNEGVVLIASLGYRIRNRTEDLREHSREIHFSLQNASGEVTPYTFVLFGERTLSHTERENVKGRIKYDLGVFSEETLEMLQGEKLERKSVPRQKKGMKSAS